MENRNLSRMEINLYNNSRIFVDELVQKQGGTYNLSMWDALPNMTKFTITSRRIFEEGHTDVNLEYFRDFMDTKRELIRIEGGLKKEYTEFITKEIPYIKKILEED